MDKLPNPITRSEQYLAKIAGENVSLPDPITREEIYLNAIANKGGGGGISGTEEWTAEFQALSFIYYEAFSERGADCVIILPSATIICNATLEHDAETGDVVVVCDNWSLSDLTPIPEELLPYKNVIESVITHDFIVADKIYSDFPTWVLPACTVIPILI